MSLNRRALIAIMFVNFVTISGFGFLFPVFAIYGNAIGAFSIGQFLSSPVWGQVSEKVVRKPILVGSLLAGAALSNTEATFTFADDVLSLRPSRIGLIFGGMGIFVAVGQFALGGPLSRMIGERGMLNFALPILAIGMTIVGTSTALPPAILGMTLIACGFVTLTPAISGMASLAAPSHQQDKALASSSPPRHLAGCSGLRGRGCCTI